MLDALTPRGVEVGRVTTLSIRGVPGAGRVDVCTRRLPEPLGRSAWLHAVKLLVEAGLKVWPDMAGVLGVVVDKARAAVAAETDGAA